MTPSVTRLFAALVALMVASPALAHTGSTLGGLLGGFGHPLLGADHVVAMLAVGIWGALLGPPAVFILPMVFPLVMAIGGVLGILGVPLPGVEILIAISGIVLGLMVVLKVGSPLWLAIVLVGAFAICHGHAHGTELPPGTDAVAYASGMVAATGFLHLVGIGFGLTAFWPAGQTAVRVGGVAIVIAGVVFLVQAV